MFPKLLKSNRLSKDLELWRSKIDSLEDPKAKLEGQKLLEEFINHARQIDAGHDISYRGDIRPDRLKDNLISLQTVRYKLQKFVKDIDS